jgi:hypothetical protein
MPFTPFHIGAALIVKPGLNRNFSVITLTELLRPWKLSALGIGIGLLVVGSFYYEAPDWDIPISIIMALMAYLTASWSMHIMVERRWQQWPLMLLWTWFTVDGCYWLYWHFKNPVALELMREANAPASLSLYWMCGLVWYYRGTLREMWVDLKHLAIKPA